MFGYIRVDRANLLGKEFDAYKGIYCALCKQLGKDYSVFSRFILSYDCTFYAMLALNITTVAPCYKQGRCRFNPFKKCLYAETESKALSLAAALSVISAYYKLKDNLIDSPWYKRLLYRPLQPFFALWRRKAAKNYPEIDASVKKMLDDQLKAESDPHCVLDKAAQPTADMLSEVCALLPDHISCDERFDKIKLKRILGAMGYYMGRWIYLTDAADDYEKDKKRNGFNPFLLSDVSADQLPSYIEASLNHSLSEALLSYGLLDKGRYDSIIMNVLCRSCVNIQNEIVSSFHNKNDKNGELNEKSI